MSNITDAGSNATFTNHSPSYQAKLASVLQIDQNLTTVMSLSVNIYSHSSLLYTTNRISVLNINQNFNTAYCDLITLMFDASPEVCNAIYCSSESLTALIIGKRVTNPESDQTPTLPVLSISGTAILSNRSDLMTKYTPSQILHNPLNTSSIETDDTNANTFQIHLQIIPDMMYDIRHIRMNYILRDGTIADAIKYAAHLFGLKLFLAPPDNNRVYDQIIIPPMLGISKIFRWLQDAPGYGIYNSGLATYVVDDTLYVYPINVLNKPLNSKLPSLTFYRVTQNSLFSDTGSIRIDDNKNYHALIDTSFEVVEPNEINFENLGNGLIIERDEALFDGMLRPVDLIPKTTRLMIDQSLTESILVKQRATPVINANNQRFVHSDGNYFRLLSSFSSSQGKYFRFKWAHAVPYAILPTTSILLYYEDNGVIQQMRGLCRNISYNITRVGQSVERYYASTGEVTIVLSEC